MKLALSTSRTAVERVDVCCWLDSVENPQMFAHLLAQLFRCKRLHRLSCAAPPVLRPGHRQVTLGHCGWRPVEPTTMRQRFLARLCGVFFRKRHDMHHDIITMWTTQHRCTYCTAVQRSSYTMRCFSARGCGDDSNLLDPAPLSMCFPARAPGPVSTHAGDLHSGW